MIPKSGRRFSDKIMLGQMLEPVLKLSEPSSSARYHGGTGPLRRVVPVTIEVSNPGNRIKAGIAGFVRVKGMKSNVTAVPTVAVIRNKDDQKSMVVCVENGRARARQVRTGAVIREGEIEVLDGLNVGDQVVVYGQKDVQEDDLVNVDWHKWTHRSELDVAAQ